jgi:hypothetical protein
VAIIRIIETGVTPEAYDQVRDRLGVGDSPPPGASLHISAHGDDGKIRIVELWDSREQAEEFGEKVRAARDEAGVEGADPQISYLEVYKVIQG